MTETPIKAVELTRSIRDQMYEETKSMTPDEFVAFITREAGKARPALATVPSTGDGHAV
ncbi:MAG TPA: hypothetical protein VE871_08490 [Longimicrobium sp.]|nr:hypothetical protein [Longimicrobium sp.]